MNKNWKKIYSWKKNIFLTENAIYINLALYPRRLSYRRSSKENIQHFKTWNFFLFFYFRGSFLPSWIRIQPTKINADPCRSGSETLKLSYILISKGYDLLQIFCYSRNFRKHVHWIWYFTWASFRQVLSLARKQQSATRGYSNDYLP